MDPPVTTGLDQPRPKPSVFHTSGGPPAGQLCRRCFSWLTPSRRGPRHWGHPASFDAIGFPPPFASCACATRGATRTAARTGSPSLTSLHRVEELLHPVVVRLRLRAAQEDDHV